MHNDEQTTKKAQSDQETDMRNTEKLTRVMKKFVVLLQRHKKDKEYLSARVGSCTQTDKDIIIN